MITATSGSGGNDVPRRLADHGEGPVNTRPDQGASGSVNRWLRPESVRHMSVTTATQRLTAAHHATRRHNNKKARETGKTQLTGYLCRWWQVLGSNQRRLSRRFYRELPCAADLRLCQLLLPFSAYSPASPAAVSLH